MIRTVLAAAGLLMTGEIAIATPQCITGMDNFDYISTSPQEFWRDTPEQISRAYGQLLKLVPDPAAVDAATQYTVEVDKYETVISRKCDKALCTGTDLLHALVACSAKTGSECAPLAAVKDGRIYCVLNPAFEHTVDRPFKPFG